MKHLKKEISVLISLIMILTLGLSGTSAFGEELSETENETTVTEEEILDSLEDLEPGTDYVEGEFIVGFKDDVNTEDAAEKIENTNSVAETEVIGDLDSAVVTVSDGEDMAEVMAEVSENSNVEYVEPNYMVYTLDDSTEIEVEEDDKQLTLEAENQGTNDYYAQYYLDSINITGLWDTVSDKAKYVSKYAIIDTGCLMSHEDLQTIDKNLSVDVTEKDSSGDYVKLVDKSNQDPDGHGTSVASVSSAQANNEVGIAGVTSCYTNDKVDTFVIGIENQSRIITIESFAAGIDYAIAKGANVINASLGTHSNSATMKKAVEKAYKAGIIIICAGGNNEWSSDNVTQDTPCYPADYPECISIAALNKSGRSCAYYNGTISSGTGYSYGEYKDFAAPGVGIRCASKYKSYPYTTETGTSFAGPIVASVVALLFTLDQNLTFNEVYTILQETATDINNGSDVDWTYEGFDPYTGYGLINASKAGCAIAGHTLSDYKTNTDGTYAATCKYCGESMNACSTPVLKSVNNYENGVTIKWNKVLGANKYRVFYKTESSGWKKAGDTTSASFKITGLKSGTTYKFTVRCVSADGKTYESAYDKTGLSLCYLKTPSLKTKNVSGGIKLTWSKVSGAYGYKIYRKTGDESYILIKKTKNNSVFEFTDDTAVNGKTYTYAIRAYKPGVRSYYISKTYVRLVSCKTNISVNTAKQSIKVKWSRNKRATGYQICIKNGTTKKYITVDSNKTLSKVIKKLKSNVAYTIYVRSYKKISGKNYYSAWIKKRVTLQM